jgi:hypothetical protein
MGLGGVVVLANIVGGVVSTLNVLVELVLVLVPSLQVTFQEWTPSAIAVMLLFCGVLLIVCCAVYVVVSSVSVQLVLVAALLMVFQVKLYDVEVLLLAAAGKTSCMAGGVGSSCTRYVVKWVTLKTRVPVVTL